MAPGGKFHNSCCTLLSILFDLYMNFALLFALSNADLEGPLGLSLS